MQDPLRHRSVVIRFWKSIYKLILKSQNLIQYSIDLHKLGVSRASIQRRMTYEVWLFYPKISAPIG